MVAVQLRHGGVTVARMPEVVAFDTVPGVRPGIEALLAEGGCRHLVLDLSRVDCFDSSGLAMLLGVQRRSETAGITLTLAAPPPFLHRMLCITQAVTLLRVVPSVQEALDPRHRAPEDGERRLADN
jgi:anti-sigma B factor antagonist